MRLAILLLVGRFTLGLLKKASKILQNLVIRHGLTLIFDVLHGRKQLIKEAVRRGLRCLANLLRGFGVDFLCWALSWPNSVRKTSTHEANHAI